MATDVEALLLQIEANTKKLEKDMAKANRIFDVGAKRMERQAKDLGDKIGGHIAERLTSSVRGIALRTSGLLAGAFSADKIIGASQSYIRASNALKVAGLSGEVLTATFGKLYTIAQANGTPIETLVGLYSKAAQVQTALGASSSQLIGFTTAVAQSLRVSGTSAEEAQGALLQMGQARGSGTVHAEEYNSMLEGAYPVLQAAAAGIKEAGGEVSKLTALVKAGEVSSKAFFYGVLAGAPILADKLAGSTETLSQAWTKFENALTKAVGEVDAATGSSASLASGLESLIPWLEALPGAIDTASKKWGSFKAAVNDASGALNRLMGYDSDVAMKAAGLTPIAEARETAAKEALAAAKTNPNTTGGGFGGDAGNADKRVSDAFGLFDKPKTPITPVSLKDYPATGAKKKGGGGSESEDEYERAIRKTQEQTEALKSEISTVGLETREKEKAKKAQELLTAAKQADKEITPALQAEIEKTSEAYAAQIEALDKAKKAHQDVIDLQKFAGESLSGFFSDIVSGGRNADEALMSLVKRLADAALQASLLGQGPLAGLFGTKAAGDGVGGLIGALFGSFKFAGGGVMTSSGPLPLRRYATGGVASSAQLALYGEGSRPEAFVPLPDGRSIPVTMALPSPSLAARNNASSSPASMHVSVDTKGANGDRAIAAIVQQGVASAISAYNRRLPSRIDEIRLRGV